MSKNNIRHLYSIQKTCELTNIGRTSIYKLIQEGKLTAKKFNSKTLITAESLHAFIESLPQINMGGDK